MRGRWRARRGRGRGSLSGIGGFPRWPSSGWVWDWARRGGAGGGWGRWRLGAAGFGGLCLFDPAIVLARIAPAPGERLVLLHHRPGAQAVSPCDFRAQALLRRAAGAAGAAVVDHLVSFGQHYRSLGDGTW